MANRVIEIAYRVRPYPLTINDLRDQFSDERRKLAARAADQLVDCGALAKNPDGYVLVDAARYDPALTPRVLEERYGGKRRLRLLDKLKERIGDHV